MRAIVTMRTASIKSRRQPASIAALSVLLVTSNVPAQNLFVADNVSQSIYEFTPGGVESNFASGLNAPIGLAFNSAGVLFVADGGPGSIYEFTPGGVRSTFASGLSNPQTLAFNSAGNLFEADFYTGTIYEFTPGGVRSTFASGLNEPTGLALQGQTLPVPEPSALGWLAVGITAFLVRRRQRLYTGQWCKFGRRRSGKIEAPATVGQAASLSPIS